MLRAGAAAFQTSDGVLMSRAGRPLMRSISKATLSSVASIPDCSRLTVCNYLDFDKTHRNFWLFDTFAGIPTDRLEGQEIEHAAWMNEHIYFDVYEYAKLNFSPFSKATLVRGILPDTLDQAKIEKIAYLSVDLNNASAEKGCINVLWPKLVPGAIIVLDDYAFIKRVLQYDMWNEFAKSVGRAVLTLPTGQGLLIK